MKRYVPLTKTQNAAIDKLGIFFDPNTAEKKTDQPPTGYIKATDLLTNKQKKEIDEHEEKIQTGFEKYSAY
jgi:hypothetical protein